jgi:hypothetical protein
MCTSNRGQRVAAEGREKILSPRMGCGSGNLAREDNLSPVEEIAIYCTRVPPNTALPVRASIPQPIAWDDLAASAVAFDRLIALPRAPNVLVREAWCPRG